MEAKKSKKADLEKKRVFFLQLGLILSLSFAFIAFQWKSPKKEINVAERHEKIEFEQEVIITMPEKEKEKIKPPEPEPEELEIIEDNKETAEIFVPMTNDWVEQGEEIFIPIEDEPLVEEPVPFHSVSKQPSFNDGGITAFYSYVNKNVQYPKHIAEIGIEGKVFVKFCIDKKGKLTDIEILRGLDKALDNEVKRVCEQSPDWEPAEQNGKKVKVFYVLPVHFKLIN